MPPLPPCCPPPGPPFYGGYPLGQAEHFRRASSSRITYPSLRPDGQSSLTPSLLLSNANPLRWALRWGPPSAACLGGKFQPVRVHWYAWLCQTNDTGLSPTVGAPIVRPPSLPPLKGKGAPVLTLGRMRVTSWLGQSTGGSPKGLPYAKRKPSRPCCRGGTCPSRHFSKWSVFCRRGDPCGRPP